MTLTPKFVIERLPDGMCRVRLVPVEIFGQQCDHPAHQGDPEPFGSGLCDAVASWSDCNRADGHLFRLDEIAYDDHLMTRAPEDVIEVLVHERDLPKFAKNWNSTGDMPPVVVFGRIEPEKTS